MKGGFTGNASSYWWFRDQHCEPGDCRTGRSIGGAGSRKHPGNDDRRRYGRHQCRSLCSAGCSCRCALEDRGQWLNRRRYKGQGFSPCTHRWVSSSAVSGAGVEAPKPSACAFNSADFWERSWRIWDAEIKTGAADTVPPKARAAGGLAVLFRVRDLRGAAIFVATGRHTTWTSGFSFVSCAACGAGCGAGSCAGSCGNNSSCTKAGSESRGAFAERTATRLIAATLPFAGSSARFRFGGAMSSPSTPCFTLPRVLSFFILIGGGPASLRARLGESSSASRTCRASRRRSRYVSIKLRM